MSSYMKKFWMFVTLVTLVVLTAGIMSVTSFAASAGKEGEDPGRFKLYTGFTATGGYSNPNGQNPEQNYTKLVDGDKDSKYCTVSYNVPSIFCEFESKSAFYPTGYVFTTARDADEYPRRNPISWTLFGKSEGTSEWEVLSEIENDDTIGAKSKQDYTFSISPSATSGKDYKYFKLQIMALKEEGTYPEFQLAEFQMIGQDTKTTPITEKAATCTEAGYKRDCYLGYDDHFYADEDMQTRLEDDDVIDPIKPHDLQHVDAKDATATQDGNIEYYYCKNCRKKFSDAQAKNEIENYAIVRYIDADGTVKYLQPDDYSLVTPGKDNWGTVDGEDFLVVPAGETVAIDNYALIKNHVHLILCDGAKLNVTGIEVPSKTVLEIHSQSKGENQGYLQSTGIASDAADGYGCCGIGSTKSKYIYSIEVRTGDIKIHGGKIYAKGSEGAPGISVGGYSTSSGDTGNLIINGGEITAEGGSGAAGIGQAEVRSTNGEFIMNGGKLTAKAGQDRDISIGTTHNSNTNGITIDFKGGELVADSSIGGEKDRVSLSWKNASDSITAGAFKYPGKVQVKKRFVYDSDNTKEFDPEEYTKDAKIIPAYVVTFNPNNGGDAFKQIIMPGSKVVKPANPKKKYPDDTSYGFDCWVDAATDEEYNFETTTPDSDLDIYAKWTCYGTLRYYDPETGTYESANRSAGEDIVDLTPKTTEISATGSETKWVFVYGTFDLKETLNIKGDVRMVFYRGARINAKKGIKVNINGKLTTYANVKEGDDIGRLLATGYSDGEQEGIRTAGISLETTLASTNEDAVLKVCGGNIYARGAGGTEGGAAGIGGDRKASGGTTLIYHGYVDADNTTGAAGIGSGYAYDGSDTTTVKIFGGKVDAGNGSASASGIGGGAYSRDKVDIDITGGTVHAIGGQEGAGIGTGRGHRSASVTTIDITGGSVTTEVGSGGAAIGSGAAATADVKIDLKNADMTCVATYDGTGIGTGKSSSANVDISISNSDIGMNLWGYSFGIGAGSNSNGNATVSITDGSKIAVDTCTRFINCKKPESSTDPDLFIDKSELEITAGAAAEGGIYGDEAVVKDSKINMKSGACINATKSTEISGSTIRQEYQSGIQENQKGIGIGHAGSTVTIDSSDIALEGKSGIAGANVTIDHSAVAVEASGTLDTDEIKGCGIYASGEAAKAALHDSQFTLSGACGIYSADKVKAGDCDLAITAPKSIRADKAELKNTPLTATGASVIEAVTALDIDGSTVKNTDPAAEFLLHAPEVSITGGSDVTAFSGTGAPIGGGSGDLTTTKLTVTDSKVTAEGPVAIGNSSAQITAKDSEIHAKGNDENAAAISADKAVFRDTDIVTETDGTGIQAADIDIINGKLDIGGDTGMGQNGAVIKLGWTRKDMEVETKSYFGTVKISRPFVYQDTGAQIAEAGHYDDVKIAKNKTIIPDAAVVTYIDADGISQTVNDFTYVTNETTELSCNKWYVIKGEVTISDRLRVTGSSGVANLILMSGAKATIEKGIEVNDPTSLLILGDTLVKDEAGSLELSSNGKDSPLGASEGGRLGTLYIFGGKIKAVTGTPASDPYNVAAAIGSAANGTNGGMMLFRRAFVTAENEFGAAIGGSGNANPNWIKIYNGEINASVAKNGMASGVSEDNYKGDAIGSGGNSTGFPVEIEGGKVRAYNGAKGAAIGGAPGDWGQGVTVTGGTVYARANRSPGIGHYGNSGKIRLFGGNVFASSSEAAGIGPAGNATSVPLELEWKELSDSIYASSYEDVTVTYDNDKPFKYKDTGAAVDTSAKPDDDRTIVPADDSVPEDPKMKDGEYVIPADKATAGTADSDYDKLVDGDKDTKWTVSLSDGPAYCEFEEISPVIPKGYILTTADNARSFLERNPSAWKLKARAGEDDDWETLDAVEGSERLTPSNKRGFIFRVDSRKEYKYFRFEIDGALKGDTAQLAELEIFGPKVEDPAQLKESETKVKVESTANLSEFIEKKKGTATYTIVEKGTGCSVDPDTGVFTAGDQPQDKVTVKITIADGEYTTGKTLELNVKVTEKQVNPLTVTMDGFTYRGTATDPVFTNPIPEVDPVITYSGMLADGSLYTEPYVKPTEAGTYAVNVKIEGDADIYEGTATFKIGPRGVFINWDSDNQFVYNYEWHYPKAYTADQDLAAMMRTDGVSITAARGERSKGEYKIPAVLDGTKKYNYTITNPNPPGTNMTIGSYVNTSVEWAEDGSWATAHFKLTPGTKTKDVAGDILQGDRVEPTCIEDGWVEKTAVFPPGETPWMSDDKTITLHDPDAHDFTDPVYKWSADSSMANAKAECRLCGYKPEETVDTTEKVITPPTSTTEGEKEVTATFTKAPFTVQTKRVVIPKREDEARAEERIAAAAAANDNADHEVSAATTKIATAEGAIGIAQTAKAEAEAAAQGEDPYAAVNKASQALSAASTAQAAAKDALTAANSAKAKAESAQSEAAEAVTAARLTGDEDLIAAANAQKDRADGLLNSAAAQIETATTDLGTADTLVADTTALLEAAVERVAGDQDLAEAVADATNALGQAQAANTVTEGNAQLAERSRQQAAEAAKTPGAAAVTAAQSALTDANAYKSAADEAAGLAATALTKAQAAYDMAVEKGKGAEVQPLLTAAQTAKQEADQAVIAAAAAVTNAEAALADAKAKAAENAEECIAEAKTACDSAENAVSAAETKIAAAKDAIDAADAAKQEAEEAAQGSDLMAAVNKASLALNAANTAQTEAEKVLAAAQSAKDDADAAKDKAAAALTVAISTGDEDLRAAASAQVARADAVATAAAAKVDAATSDLSTAKALVGVTQKLLEDAVEKISDDQELIAAIVEASNAVGKAETANTVTENNAEKAEKSRKDAEQAAKTPGDAAVAAAGSALKDAEAYKNAANEAAGLAATALEKAQAAYDTAVAKGKAADVEPLLAEAQKAKQDADKAAAAADQAVKNAEAALADAKAKAEEAKKKDARNKQKGLDGTYFGTGASLEAAEAAIGAMTSDRDPSGTKIIPLRLRSTKQTKTSIKLVWNKASGATQYAVFGNLTGKNNKMKKLTTTSAGTFNVRKITANLKKGKYYKFMVIAVNGNNDVVSSSKIVYVSTKGSKKAANPKGLKVKKPKKLKVRVKRGKTYKIKAAVTKARRTKVKKYAALRYASSNPAIATVASNGRIRGVQKGSAKIYVYAQNGLMKTIRVTVK